jgi:hypothetical protein
MCLRLKKNSPKSFGPHCVSMYVRMYVCMYVLVFVMYVCMYVHMYAFLHVRMPKYNYMHMCMLMQHNFKSVIMKPI